MKLKNFCPYSVGDILVTTTTTNPSTKYLNTTWELIPSDRYIRSSGTALSTGGSNSISIAKANLPNIKLKVDSHSHTQPAHTHEAINYFPSYRARNTDGGNNVGGGTIYRSTDSAGGENTGSSSLSTESLGSGTAISVQPAYITLKFWKRLT